MRETLTIQVGGCGNKIGNQFWSILSEQHSINSDGNRDITHNQNSQTSEHSEHPSTFFYQLDKSKYIPRSILVDLEPGTLDTIKGGELGKLFAPQSYINGKLGGGNNYAFGYYLQGAEIKGQIVERARRQYQKCDEGYRSIQYLHSTKGGTGSGLTVLLVRSICQTFCNTLSSTYSVLPSKQDLHHGVQIYNSILAVHQLIYNGNMCTMFDNSSLYNISSRNLNFGKTSVQDLNRMVATDIANITSGIRFRGPMNYDIPKLATNLIPFPRLHLLITSVAPLNPNSLLNSKSQNQKIKLRQPSVSSLVQKMFDKDNIMCSVNPCNGKYYSSVGIFRGSIPTQQLQSQMMSYESSNQQNFISWLPNHITPFSSPQPPTVSAASATLLGNSTSMVDKMKWLNQAFCQLFKRKCFIHWFTSNGMDQMEFVEAESNVNDLICEYEQSINYFDFVDIDEDDQMIEEE